MNISSLISLASLSRRLAAVTPNPVPRELAWLLKTKAAQALGQSADLASPPTEAPLDAPNSPFTPGIPAAVLAPAGPPRAYVVRPRRRRYPRDSLTLPAMVAVYNVLLVWMLFNIDVRASSL